MNELYAKTFDRQRWGYLGYATRLFQSALKEQGKQFTEGGIEAVNEMPIEIAFQRLYLSVGKKFGQQTFTRLKSQTGLRLEKTSFDWDAVILRWLETNTFDLIVNITNTTRRGIEVAIEEGIRDGLSIEDIGRQLSERYVLSRQRARLIGRTEIIRASNAGSFLGAQETGLEMGKVWIPVGDERTRREPFDHMNVGKVNTLESLFNVSGEFMKYPCDHTNGASAGNTINCRCVIGYEPFN